MTDQAENSCIPAEPGMARNVVKRPRRELGAAPIECGIDRPADVTPIVGEAANGTASLYLGPALTKSIIYRSKDSKLICGAGCVSSLQAYWKAVRHAFEQELLRPSNDGENVSATKHESQIDTAKIDLKAKCRALSAGLNQSQRWKADKTQTAGECGK
ncbi:MAG: hypothetical protein ACOZAM_09425 [Pseudomonadota bacterium]